MAKVAPPTIPLIDNAASKIQQPFVEILLKILLKRTGKQKGKSISDFKEKKRGLPYGDGLFQNTGSFPDFSC